MVGPSLICHSCGCQLWRLDDDTSIFHCKHRVSFTVQHTVLCLYITAPLYHVLLLSPTSVTAKARLRPLASHAHMSRALRAQKSSTRTEDKHRSIPAPWRYYTCAEPRVGRAPSPPACTHRRAENVRYRNGYPVSKQRTARAGVGQRCRSAFRV